MPDVSSGGLPRPLTSFIDRERELAQARRLLAGSYLVTLTGPGGSGKTRLCIALAGAPAVARLLQETSALRVLVSSRSSLRISGEQECPVPPLAVPDPGTGPAPEALAGCESVRLFAERAAAVLPDFAVDEQNAPAIAQIARRLDGLPLALELAAARVKLLPPEAILARLEHSLRLLTGGGRDLPDRQQTLRATIAWSHDLLSEGARRLLAACSVFAGGASLEAIETVCDAAADIGLPVLDGLAELLDQNLMRQVRRPGPVRYALLETIREYAAERLDQLPAADRVRAAHAAAFLALVEADGRLQPGLARKDWLERVEVEHNNIRAAIGWYREHAPPAALRMAAAMTAFWSVRGHHTEGRQRLDELLVLAAEPSPARVSALNGAAWLAIDQGDYAHGAGLLGESIELGRALGDTVGEAIATVYLGRCKMSSLDTAAGAPDVRRAAALVGQTGDGPATTLVMFYSGIVALLTGQPEAACDVFGCCAATAAELGLTQLTARARQMLSYPLLDLGELAAARAALAEGVPISTQIGDRWIVQIGLGGFIGLAVKTGRPQLALRLAGAAGAYRAANEFSMPVPMQEIVDRWLGPARTRAGRAAGRLVAEGQRLSPEEAVRLALANAPDDAVAPGPRPTLTRRETEVAALAARGLTNRDIAARLFLSVRTVEAHVDHILTKLGFRTRTQLAAWAYEEGLLAEDT